MDEHERQPIATDMSKLLLERSREALQVLFPGTEEFEERIKLITELSGRKPEIRELLGAAIEWEGWTAMIEKRPIKWTHLSPEPFLKAHAPSIGGKRAQQAVEIARATPSPERRRRSLLDFFTGGR